MNATLQTTVPWTQAGLLSLLAVRGCKTVRVNGIVGSVSSIEREDGSGRCYNVTMNTAIGKRVTYVRTVD